MHVVILCGGRGTRLGDLARTIPKSLIPCKGDPFLARQLRKWREIGAQSFTLVTGHLGGMIGTHVDDHERNHCPVRCVVGGTSGTWSALQSLDGLLSEREFVLTYGDVFPSWDTVPRAGGLARMGLAAVEGEGNMVFKFGGVRPARGLLAGMTDHLDAGAIALRTDVLRIPALSPDLRDLWTSLASLSSLSHFYVPRPHEVGSLAGLEKFNASL